jgi:hypothetical protein
MIEMLINIRRLAEFRCNLLARLLPILGDNLITQTDTLITNVDRRTRNKLSNLIAVFSTEGATKIGLGLSLSRHEKSLLRP